MSIPSNTLATFRDQWASRFIDTITVIRVTSRGTYNPTTHLHDGGGTNAEYSGGALIRPMSAAGQTALFGEQQVTGKAYYVFIPYDAAFTGNPQPEDRVTIDASSADPDLVGRTMLVVSASHDSYQTRIELICRLEEGPGYAD